MSLFYSYFFGVPGGAWMALSVAGYITYYLSKCVQVSYPFHPRMEKIHIMPNMSGIA